MPDITNTLNTYMKKKKNTTKTYSKWAGINVSIWMCNCISICAQVNNIITDIGYCVNDIKNNT